MTAWHLLKLWGAVAAVGIVAVAGLLLWPLVWPTDPDRFSRLVHGRLVGEMEGFVWRVELDQHRFHVTSSLLGLGSVPITVTPETKIVVSNKLGGIGDIWKGMDVRVAYEMRDDQRVATAVELLTSKARRSRTTPTEVIVPAEAAPDSAAPVPTSAGAAPAVQRSSVRQPPKRTEARPVESRPAPPAPLPSAPAAAAPQPSDADGADGSAAIDWLLKGSRR